MIELRPPTLEDLPELAEFFAGLEQSGGRGESESDIRDTLTNPVFDIEANFRIALDGGRIVGWVSSGGYGYSVGQSIVYAYLPMECTKVGTRLEIEFFGEQVSATVVQSPLWDPKGERIRA